MSPRERAVALGWACYGSRWCRTRRGRTPIVWESSTPRRGWGFHPRGAYAQDWMDTRWFRTEDEALEHALLLLDVWLS